MFARPSYSAVLRPASRLQAAKAVSQSSSIRISPLSPFATRALSQETRSAISKAIESAPVVLFMKGTPDAPQCGYSRATLQILAMQGVDPARFTAYNVLEDEELRSGIKEYSDWPTIPQLYVKKNFVGGCDILMSMHQNGELAKLLEEHRVLVEKPQESDQES